MKKLLLSILMLLPLALFAQQDINQTSATIDPPFIVYYTISQTGPSWTIRISDSDAALIRSYGYQVVFNRSAQEGMVSTDNYSYAAFAGQRPPVDHQVPPGDESNVFIQVNSDGDGFWGRYNPNGPSF